MHGHRRSSSAPADRTFQILEALIDVRPAPLLRGDLRRSNSLFCLKALHLYEESRETSLFVAYLGFDLAVLVRTRSAGADSRSVIRIFFAFLVAFVGLRV
jgi:hypothetical protein